MSLTQSISAYTLHSVLHTLGTNDLVTENIFEGCVAIYLPNGGEKSLQYLKPSPEE